MADELSIIETSRALTDKVLETVEENYARYLESNITHHKYLLEIAEKEGDLHRTAHHRVLLETFETMLENHKLSCKYATI